MDPNREPRPESVAGGLREDRRRRPMHIVIAFALLMPFWLLLSGHYDTFHISLGVFCCLLVSRGSADLLFGHIGLENKHVVAGRYLTYIPWHFWQIVLSNIHVAKLVLSPRPPINPRIISFPTKLTNDLALVTFANSITLTPGTITLDLINGIFHVHAIDDAVADDLLGGEMENRIDRIFLRREHREE
ncbi:MAG: Na+/H+ antiporter subunit E [Deltaproteobacteria bacterium]|nr:Na+/H+ antiporter subunit E [Candidatus Anaeroferrophillacea bacterium]